MRRKNDLRNRKVLRLVVIHMQQKNSAHRRQARPIKRSVRTQAHGAKRLARRATLTKESTANCPLCAFELLWCYCKYALLQRRVFCLLTVLLTACVPQS